MKASAPSFVITSYNKKLSNQNNPEQFLYPHKFNKQAFTSRILHNIHAKQRKVGTNIPSNKSREKNQASTNRVNFKTDGDFCYEPLVFPLPSSRIRKTDQNSSRVCRMSTEKKGSISQRHRLLSPKILPISVSNQKKTRVFSANFRERVKSKSENKLGSKI